MYIYTCIHTLYHSVCVCMCMYLHTCMSIVPVHSEISSSLPDPHGHEGVDGSEVAVTVESFTQPTSYDELVISTQVPCTPGATEVYSDCSTYTT